MFRLLLLYIVRALIELHLLFQALALQHLML